MAGTGLTPTATGLPPHRWLIPLLVALVPASALLTRAAGLEMHFDEAQYWEWSRHLDWSYYSKGPLVAWLIAASEAVFGHGEWQTRLPAWILHSLWLGLVYGLAREVWDSRRAAATALVLAMTTPIYLALGLVMTTDIVLFCAWTAALWAIVRAVVAGHPRAWYAAGAAIGVGALGKLSIALLPIAVLPHLVWRHGRRLRSIHPWAACLLMLSIMSPLLVWNLQHDWVMFRHELHHVEGDGRAGILDFIAGQWLALSPLVVIVAARALWRRPAGEAQCLLLSSGLLVLVFFTVKAMAAKVQVNWPAPAYIGLLILAAGPIQRLDRRWRGLLQAGILSSLLIVSLAFFPSVIGLGPNKDPLRIMRGWRQTVERIAAAAPKTGFVMTHNYQLAAELAYYWPGPGPRPPVYILSFGQRRYNQHDLWPGIERESGRDGLYVSTSTIQPIPLARAFDDCGRPRAITVKDERGRRRRVLYVTQCRHYRANARWLPPTGY